MSELLERRVQMLEARIDRAIEVQAKLEDARQKHHQQIMSMNNALTQWLDDQSKREEPTLRDHFAMAALRGIIGNSFYQGSTPGKLGEIAYKYADATIEARNKGD